MIKIQILGLDLSTTSSGISILEDNKLIYNKLISPNKKDNIIDRMIYTQNEISKIINKYKIEYVAIEDVAISIQRNAKTCHDLLLLVGMVFGLFNTKDIYVSLMLPSHWRSLAGIYDEKKTREQMKREFQKQKSIEVFNNIFNLNLEWIDKNNDDKIHHSDLAESALIAVAFKRELEGVI